jgi:flavin-dependent dehydrogenase
VIAPSPDGAGRTRIDIAVVGGGPAGVAAAIGLAQAGGRVLLLERDAAPRFKPGEILEPTIKHSFAEIGVAGFDALDVISSTGNVSIWGGDEPIESDSILNPHGQSYLVDRERLERWLLDEARRRNVVVVQGVGGLKLETGRTPRLAWHDAGQRREIRPQLVVDATGRDGGLAGPLLRTRVDRLVGVLAYVQCDAPDSIDPRIYIEAARDGWWYSAPLPTGQCVIGFMTDADFVGGGKDRKLALFKHQIARTTITRARLTDGVTAPVMRTCPAMSTIRHTIYGRGWVAVGDAAATYDPLSGRGVAAALARGVALARVVAASGVDRGVKEYADAERAAYEDYLVARCAIYRRERRWLASRFWSRRH